MYTECPECEVAFRVTADVLKQAAGKVRCGGCGVAFNALAHLSEEMPGTAVKTESPVEPEPFEADDSPELEAGTPPQAISAEQSAALLKTLDQLAGEDIRIEDTGVEWRVIADDGDDIDKALADDPVSSATLQEMRFDDNTPLPDDFDLDATPSPAPAIESDAEPEPEPEPEHDLETSQVDLVFGEPDEWEDLLGDLDEAVEAVVDQPLDVDTQFALQAEELGLDLGGQNELLAEDDLEIDAPEQLADDSQAESEEELVEEPEEEPEEVSETSIEEDLIAAAFEIEAAAREDAEAAQAEEESDEEAINLDHVNPEELSRAGILDEDDYLDVITEEDEEAVLDEIHLEDSPQDQMLAQAVLEDEIALEAAVEALEEDDLPEQDELAEANLAEEDVLEEDELAEDDPESIEYAEPVDVEVPEQTEEEMTVNMMIDEELLAIAVEDDDGFTSTIVQKQVSGDDDLPAENDEIAEDPSAQEDAAEDDVADGKAEDEADVLPAEFAAPTDDDGNPLMETIIMEGESIVNEQDEERLAAARAAASESLKKADFDKQKTSFRDWQPPKHSMAAAAALLFVVLIFQVIHYSREALAVSPAFQNTVGPIYRMVGNPVTPAWDVKGWRFEATKGSTNEAGDVLTIYSRIGNNSDQTLPYPLVHVSLTDRFEEIIGSRVLEPADYLVDNADPSSPVKPRESFNAVIAIDSPSAAATSFKLNVCYRLASGQLRCADKDFR